MALRCEYIITGVQPAVPSSGAQWSLECVLPQHIYGLCSITLVFINKIWCSKGHLLNKVQALQA
uniref:Uncharacterized protein n=1 Tax=Arundo donax TaxID=35708 RepID=A0A0A9CBZ2_ARUDO